MKIVLVRYHDNNNINTRLPESLNKKQGVLPPLGIAYIAGSLERAGHDVTIIDAMAENLTRNEVKEKIKESGAKIVGVTCMTPTIHGALEACEIAKECGTTVIIGGVHLEVYPKETLSYDYIDYGVIGEGEETIVELVEAIEKNKDVSNIKGIAYKKNGEVFINPVRIIEDIDSLPTPARHLLPIKKYNSIIGLYPMTTMMTSRGCPFKCGFCFKSETDKFLRLRDPIKVVDEMEDVIKQYGIKEIMFYDDTFTWNKKHVIDICNEILRRKIKVKWEAPTRVNTIDEELLKLMKKAGCRRLRFGVESGDPEILKLMNKNINVPMVKKAIGLTRKIGIESFAYFIIGYANETPKTIRKTINLAKELDCDLVMFTVATPAPETPLYAMAFEKGLINFDYWKKFTLKEIDSRFPYFVPDAEDWIKKAYREFYFRPKYILRQFFKIRSWDDVKKRWWAFKGILFFSTHE